MNVKITRLRRVTLQSVKNALPQLGVTRHVQREAVSGRMDEILNPIRELLEPQFQHSETRLTIELPVVQIRDKLLVADTELTQAALLNLVQHALEACRPGGQVRVFPCVSAG